MKNILTLAFTAALAFAAGTYAGAALEPNAEPTSIYSARWDAGQGIPLDAPYVSRANSECLTDTDCEALADSEALIGWGCEPAPGESAYWGLGQPLYRDFEDEFPATCEDIYPVHVLD